MITKIVTTALGLYLNGLALVAPQRAAKNGFLLFCRPMRPRLNPKQLNFMKGSGAFTIDHDGETVQVYKWGSGKKKVLFLHGWQSHTYRWKSYIDALSGDDYTIYSIDAPGHGLSSGSFLSVPVYGALIQRLLIDLGEVDTIVGHSIGAFSLLYTFHRNPLLNVGKVVLMAPPGEATDFLEFYQKTLGLSNRTMQLIHQHFATVYQVPPAFFSTIKFANALKVPGLVIHDQQDDEAPFQYSVEVSKRWKNGQLVATNGFGHNLRSPEVVKTVTEFIRRVEPTIEQVATSGSLLNV